MLVISIFDEGFDQKKQEFVKLDEVVLELEHSLVSLSKWESKYERPFLSSGMKNEEEMLSYIEFMTLTPVFPPGVFSRLSEKNLDEINEYLAAKMSATWFRDDPSAPKNREIITAEVIYHWMISHRIPVEFENWHLNRLLTLIRVCNEKSAPPKKLSKGEVAQRNRELNARRRAEMGTAG